MNKIIKATRFEDKDALFEHELNAITKRAMEILEEMKPSNMTPEERWFSDIYPGVVRIAFRNAYLERAETVRYALKLKGCIEDANAHDKEDGDEP